MNATPTTIGIADATGTDGFTTISEYSDGSQSERGGWYGSFQDAWNDVARYIEDFDLTGVTIGNWTNTWTDEEIAEHLDCLIDHPLIEAEHAGN